ncbi:hypothetical protein V1282_003546 [Nitrobacteraceae bacterium AZCC 2146]
MSATVIPPTIHPKSLFPNELLVFLRVVGVGCESHV